MQLVTVQITKKIDFINHTLFVFSQFNSSSQRCQRPTSRCYYCCLRVLRLVSQVWKSPLRVHPRVATRKNRGPTIYCRQDVGRSVEGLRCVEESFMRGHFSYKLIDTGQKKWLKLLKNVTRPQSNMKKIRIHILFILKNTLSMGFHFSLCNKQDIVNYVFVFHLHDPHRHSYEQQRRF